MTETITPAPGDKPNRKQYLPSADNVQVNLRNAGASPEQVSTILWFLDYGREQRLSQVKLAKVIKRDGGTLSKVFGGKYTQPEFLARKKGEEKLANPKAGEPVPLDKIVSDIEHFRKIHTERKAFGEEPFVELKVTRQINGILDLARVSMTMAWIYGPNQSGKTRGAKHYRDQNNHGRTVYVRMPVGGSAKMFMVELMRACGISERNCYAEMRDRALRFFSPEKLLIIDEFHQTMVGRSLKMVTIELIRELHDHCRCGVVLVATDILPDTMSNEKFKNFLGQTDNRGILRLRVPKVPYKQDIRDLCAAYGLPPAEGEAHAIVDGIANQNGIGKLSKYLLMSRKLAAKSKQAVTWQHFLTTHATLKSWQSGEGDK